MCEQLYNSFERQGVINSNGFKRCKKWRITAGNEPRSSRSRTLETTFKTEKSQMGFCIYANCCRWEQFIYKHIFGSFNVQMFHGHLTALQTTNKHFLNLCKQWFTEQTTEFFYWARKLFFFLHENSCFYWVSPRWLKFSWHQAGVRAWTLLTANICAISNSQNLSRKTFNCYHDFKPHFKEKLLESADSWPQQVSIQAIFWLRGNNCIYILLRSGKVKKN